MKQKSKFRRRLGVNIDHIATLREARKSPYPDPVQALAILKKCKVDQVTIHLREDRRHIQDHDLMRIIKANVLPVNLELAVTPEMIGIALKQKPKTCTFVPEKREEITTEGGLDCLKQIEFLTESIARLKRKSIQSSLFINADPVQIQAAKQVGADAIEIHTGHFCHIIEDYFIRTQSYNYQNHQKTAKLVAQEREKIATGSKLAAALGLKVYAGHGFHCYNLASIVTIPQIEEYNIGHSIIARSVFIGLEAAIKEIQNCLTTK